MSYSQPITAHAPARLTVPGQLWRLATLGRQSLTTLGNETFSVWTGRGAPHLGAALAYYALFSLAPLLMVVIAIVGLAFGAEAARGEIAPRLEGIVGPRGADAVQLLLSRAGTRGGGIVTTLIGLVSVFFGATLVINELRNTLNIVWDVRPEGEAGGGLLSGVGTLLSDRLFAFLSVMALGGLLVCAAMFSSIVAFVGVHFEAWLPVPELALDVLNVTLSWAMATVMFALIYLRLPDAEVARADAVVGAMVTALLFGAGGVVIPQLVGRAAASSAYGTAGSVLALLVWLYYSTLVFLFGAAFTAVFAQRHGGGITPRRRSIPVPFTGGGPGP